MVWGRRPFWVALGAGLLLIALLIGVSRLFQGEGKRPPLQAPSQAAAPPHPQAVRVLSLFDFQCPFCAQFARDGERRLREDYVARGLVVLEPRQFPILGPESVLAAQASECAREQGRFWDYYDLLFQRQKGRNQGTFSLANLKSWARESGLDGPRFDRCLDTGQALRWVRAHVQEGERLGVRATPTLLVEGLRIEGLMPWERLRPLIEDALRRKGVTP